ncbi:hypothetical protein JCM10213v2_002315 [Rhodosporidiobolus nylandii]
MSSTSKELTEKRWRKLAAKRVILPRKIDFAPPIAIFSQRRPRTNRLGSTAGISKRRTSLLARCRPSLSSHLPGSEKHDQAVHRHHHALTRLRDSHKRKAADLDTAIAAADKRHAARPSPTSQAHLHELRRRRAKQQARLVDLEERRAEVEREHGDALARQRGAEREKAADKMRRKEERRRAAQKAEREKVAQARAASSSRSQGRHPPPGKSEDIPRARHIHPHSHSWHDRDLHRQRKADFASTRSDIKLFIPIRLYPTKNGGMLVNESAVLLRDSHHRQLLAAHADRRAALAHLRSNRHDPEAKRRFEEAQNRVKRKEFKHREMQDHLSSIA